MRKLLLGSVAAISLLLPFAAFADSVIHSNFGGYMYPIPVSVSNPWVISGTAGNYALVYDITSNDYFTYLGHQVPFTRTTDVPWSGGRVGHTFALVASNALSGPCTSSNYAACKASPNFQGEERFVYGVAPPPPPPPPPFHDGFSHIMNTPVMLASVVNGVQTTGKQIWPLLVFVGLIIAFYIFRMVGNSIIASAQARNSASKPYSEEYTPQQITAITDKIKELGDRDSFG